MKKDEHYSGIQNKNTYLFYDSMPRYYYNRQEKFTNAKPPPSPQREYLPKQTPIDKTSIQKKSPREQKVHRGLREQ